MMKRTVDEKRMAVLAFLNRENDFRHHYYNEEMLQYEYLKAGDMRAIPESVRMFSSSELGTLSDDPLRNFKYLFVASTTLATRFAIEGGVDGETAYNASDLYIQQADRCGSIDDLKSLQTEMFEYFTKKSAAAKKKNIYSAHVTAAIEYICGHLHETVRMKDLAETTGLNASYLSTLFKKETGISVTQYILDKRTDTAKNMLKHSDYTAAEISSLLAFHSQSYFSKVFKEETGMTPGEYRSRNYRISFAEDQPDSPADQDDFGDRASEEDQ